MCRIATACGGRRCTSTRVSRAAPIASTTNTRRASSTSSTILRSPSQSITRSARDLVDEAPAPVLAGLGGLASPGGRSRGSARWRAGAARSRSSRCVPQSRHWRRCTQRGALARGSPRTRRLGGRSRRRGCRSRCVARRRRPATPRPSGARARSARCPGADVEHRLLDVEHRRARRSTTSCGDRAGAADLQHLARARRRSSPAGAGRRPRSGVSSSAAVAEPLPGGEVALLDALARSASHDVVRVVVLDAPRAARSRPATPAASSVARASASSQRVGRRHPQPAHQPRQREPCMNSVPAATVKRDQQQHLAVRRAPRGSRTPRPASPRRACPPSRAGRCSVHGGCWPVSGSGPGRTSR